MNQEKPKQRVKTLSIRIPESLYLTISQYVLDNDLPSINSAVISLVNRGIRGTEESENAVSEFILELIPQDKLQELANGIKK